MIKVENIIRDNDKIFAEGKLVLVLEERIISYQDYDECKLLVMLEKPYYIEHNMVNATEKIIKPIIISDTEKLSVGDKTFDNHTNEIFTCGAGNYDKLRYKKILAMPENFSHEILKEIVEVRLKDGDRVLVECEKYDEKNEQDKYDDGTYARSYSIIDLYRIKMDDKNYISVFKKKTVQEKSLEAVDELLRTLPEEEIQRMLNEVIGKSKSGLVGFHDVSEFYKEETGEILYDCKKCGGKIINGNIETKWCNCPVDENEENWSDIENKCYESGGDYPEKIWEWLKENYNIPTKKC